MLPAKFTSPPFRIGWITIAAAVALLRLIECALPPYITGDLGRHLITANMVNAQGWSAAAILACNWAPAAATHASWTDVPYNYPPLALWFFQAVAAVHASLFAAKLALTLIEAVNAWLLARLTGNALFGLAYWCLPLSIWWVSREGQFEPVQSFFVLIALLCLKRGRPDLAPAAVALAVQTKLSALFIAPWLGLRAFQLTGKPRLRMIGFLLLALLPTLAMFFAYPVFTQVWKTMTWPAHSNVYNWHALTQSGYRWWLPLWFVIYAFSASALLLGVVVFHAFRNDRRDFALWFAPLLFLVGAKFLGVFQGWYFIGLIPLWLPAVPAGQRLKWLLLTQLCEPLSLWELFFGPAGPGSPQIGVDVFSLCWHP